MIIRRLNLAARSALFFSVFCLLIVALGGAALQQASKSRAVNSYFQFHIVPAVKELGDLDANFSDVRFSNAVLRNAQEKAENRSKALSAIQVSLAKIDENFKRITALELSAQEQQSLKVLQTSANNFNQAEHKYLALSANNNLPEAMQLADDVLSPASVELQDHITAFVSGNDQRAKAYGEQAQAVFESTFTLVVGAVVCAVLACIGLAWQYTRSVLIPVRQALRIAQRIAADDLSEVVVVSGQDELADLLSALATMQENLGDALGKINDSSSQLAATSEELHAITEDSSKGMERQNNELEMAATAVTEMTAAIEEVARNAAGALEVAAQSSQAASNGRERVDETLAAIAQMVGRVQDSSTSVEQLASVASDINQVLAVIRAVAEQTNLLALNAAIEAARAGEAGRGFAVVADEVRSLARRTQDATQTIEQMMGGVSSCSAAALQAMGQTRSQAETTLQLSTAAGQALAEINQTIEQINERSMMIATAAEEQAQVAHEVDRSLISIRDLAVQSTEGAQQTTLASGELSYLAVDLSQLVKRFKF